MLKTKNINNIRNIQNIRKFPLLMINNIAKNIVKIRQLGKKELLHHQESLLFELINKSKKTVFGQKYNFKDIKTISDFQNYIPIFTYKEFKPRIEYMLRGERNISYPGKIPLFAISSGTTGKKGKYIPLTNEHIKKSQFSGGEKAIARYCKANPKTKIFTGKMIAIGGTFIKNPYTQKNNVGYITAILQKKTPFFYKLFKRPKPETAFIEDREEKTDKIIKETIGESITGITGQPSRCTQFMYNVLEETNKQNIHEVWPDFEVFLGGGMAIDLYKETLKELLPDKKFHYRQSYNASEGFFATQIENDANDMLLLTDNGVFYEFIPVEEYGKSNPKIITLQDVELNQNYVLVITTNAGLRRYIIGDTIKFTEIEPFYKIEITGRTKYYIDIVGEGTTVEYTDKAIMEACKQTGTIVVDYTVGPISPRGNQKGAYERIIEFNRNLKNQELQNFTKILDQELQNAFSNYYDERNYNNTLDILKVHAITQGTFQKRLKASNKELGQSKIPKLSNNRTILNDILKYIKK